MTEYIKRPEILAPAGNFESLKAAVHAGADAVYLGGEIFSARAYAGNFDEEELLRAIEYCHLFDIKIYMTINTLFKDEETERLLPYLEPFYRNGLDAVLVQDLGAADLIHREYPHLPLHASTQMSISSAFGVEFLKDIGFTRVVPARELGLDEIISIKKKTGIEIETFVQGAMCFAYSGKCLFSSFLGGRSGNRGRCAQPCRRCYSHEDGQGYIMSLKDMSVLKDVPELMLAGIDSFKIEGRMKNPEYVASAVNAYKTIRDMTVEIADGPGLDDLEDQRFQELLEKKEKELKDIYNRGGFSKGYYNIRRGGEMFADKRPNHDGLLVGRVKSLSGADMTIEAFEDINIEDVLEIRAKDKNIEITSNKTAITGSDVTLKGRELSSIKKGDAVYRTHNKALLQKIQKDIIFPERKLLVNAIVTAKEGEPLAIELTEKRVGRPVSKGEDDPGSDNVGKAKHITSVRLNGEVPAKAVNRSTTEEELAEKMRKTSGSNIEVYDIEIKIDDGLFIPMSAFNNLRREAIDAFKNEKIKQYLRK